MIIRYLDPWGISRIPQAWLDFRLSAATVMSRVRGKPIPDQLSETPTEPYKTYLVGVPSYDH